MSIASLAREAGTAGPCDGERQLVVVQRRGTHAARPADRYRQLRRLQGVDRDVTRAGARQRANLRRCHLDSSAAFGADRDAVLPTQVQRSIGLDDAFEQRQQVAVAADDNRRRAALTQFEREATLQGDGVKFTGGARLAGRLAVADHGVGPCRSAGGGETKRQRPRTPIRSNARWRGFECLMRGTSASWVSAVAGHMMHSTGCGRAGTRRNA